MKTTSANPLVLRFLYTCFHLGAPVFQSASPLQTSPILGIETESTITAKFALLVWVSQTNTLLRYGFKFLDVFFPQRTTFLVKDSSKAEEKCGVGAISFSGRMVFVLNTFGNVLAFK